MLASSATTIWAMPPDVKSIEVNGYPIAYKELGAGVPVVLIHGSIGDYRVWNAQLTAFAKRNRVLTPSLRHYFPEAWNGEGGKFSIGSAPTSL